jgi:predicted enzyme related to lactoylglutathione lyase
MVSLASVVLHANDLETTTRFYAALGLVLDPEQHDGGLPHAVGRIDGNHFSIHQAPPGPVAAAPAWKAPASAMFGFYVDDLDHVVSTVVNSGARDLTGHQQRAWGCRHIVTDPDGRAVELNQRGHCSGEPPEHHH